MFFFHSGADFEHHESAGRIAFTLQVTDQQLARRVGMRHVCAACGHVSQHPDPAELRLMARLHADNCRRMVA